MEHGERVAIVDPGDAAPVEDYLRRTGRRLETILLTHHHADHTGGVAELVRVHGVRVYGPVASPYPAIDVRLREGDRVVVFGRQFQVLEVPGHTLDHIAYWCPDLAMLFCGDTLFACGCGRLFEGNAEQMFASLGKLAALPGATRAYCAHEYTASNIRFARAVEPENPDLLRREADCAAARSRGEPTVPSTLALEQATNPFLRSAAPAVLAAATRRRPGIALEGPAVFAAIRAWKDEF